VSVTTADGGEDRAGRGAVPQPAPPDDPSLRELLLQYLRVRALLDEELAPRRRARGEPRPLVGSPLYPSEAMRDLALFFYLMAVLCLLSAVAPPELGDPANPDVTPDRLLPDWYLLWAFGLLKLAPNVELFGVPFISGKLLGVLLIVVTFVAVLLVPWIDRAITYLGRSYFRYSVSFSEGRRPRRPMADPFMAALGAGALTYALTTSVYSIREIMYANFTWMSDGELVTLVVGLPFVVGIATYAGLIAARRTDDYEWRLSQCHGCGRCDEVCPVRPVRGERRINLVYLTGSDADDHVWTCLGCDRCSTECPQGISMSPHTLRMRASGIVDEPPRGAQRCRDVLAWHARRASLGPAPMPARPGEGIGRVGHFAPCSHLLQLTRVSHDFGDAPSDTVRLLEAAGAQVYELPHVCCGHDALWQGERATFERLREANTASILASGVDTVVTECAECYRTLARDYDLVGVRVLHVSQYLAARQLPLGPPTGPQAEAATGRPLRVAYHDPCRLGRHMGVYDAPRELIRSVPGVELVELEESRERAQCCGVAAMMNCDQASKGLRARRLEQVRRAGADALVTTCPKCITHLVCMQDEGGHESFRIMDLVELLAERLPAPAPQAAVGTVEAPSEGEGRAPARTAEPAVEGTVEGEPEDEGRKGRKGRRGGRRAGRKGKGRKGEAASRDDAAEGGVRP
jgi:heterodisulfide reductase subunit D